MSDELRFPRIEYKNFTETLPDGTVVPAGGYVIGTGMKIEWQNGPLGRDGERKVPNGAFVEDVIAAAIQRLEHYNDGRFRCRENSLAITHLEEALLWCNARTARREREHVEGTHEGN